MEVIKTIVKMRGFVNECKAKKLKIGFVPTMGAFHEGHLSLIRAARKETDIVVVSIFVNPLQFCEGEDYDAYPRQPENDIKLCKENQVDCVFMPEIQEMYPRGFLSYVDQHKLTEQLCGKFRPGHFRGVMTVVAKLFNIVRPDIAYFGQKDYQQYVIIQRMVEDLNFDITVKMLPIVREQDGLAMSSRNVYLKKTERKQSALIYKALQKAEQLIREGKYTAPEVIRRARVILRKIRNCKVQYFLIVNAETLEPVYELKGKLLVAIAVKIGKARLIDNILID